MIVKSLTDHWSTGGRELTGASSFNNEHFSYTFGSIYNNVVNPRFGNSRGGGMMIIMN